MDYNKPTLVEQHFSNGHDFKRCKGHYHEMEKKKNKKKKKTKKKTKALDNIRNTKMNRWVGRLQQLTPNGLNIKLNDMALK